jgi:hypothetical protein
MVGGIAGSTETPVPAATHTVDRRQHPWIWPLLAGALGAASLTGLYLGIVTLAQGWQHAVELFWLDRFLVLPILAGFGTQVALYTYVKIGLHTVARGAGAMAGAGGGTSTAAMVACCAHHVTDLLPLVGLSAAATFLANYRVPFMVLGIAMNLVGIGLAVRIIWKEKRRAGLAGTQPVFIAANELK